MTLGNSAPSTTDLGSPPDPVLEPTQVAPDQRAPRQDDAGPAWARLLHEVSSGFAPIAALAIFSALVVGGILIAATSPQVQAALSYFFARPASTFGAIGQAVGGAYASLFRGGVYDVTQPTFAAGITPLMTSLSFATPLIAAGLGIGIGFRAGVFNIGGQGQILVGGALAGWIGYAFPLPAGIHLLVALVCGVVGAAVFAGIAGVLKATTGAHEVIVTIMLNYVALYGLSYLLTGALKSKESNNPISPAEAATAVFPSLLGSQYELNLGFVVTIGLTFLAWWMMTRSSLGFRLRAVGENPRAASNAGISVKRVVVYTMLISGAFVGVAGVYQVLGQTTTGFTSTLDAGIGFNAITVALLGRNKPWGIFGAGVLFGVFQAGGYTMQAAQGIDIDIVQVLQAIIVLFVAAPPLVRAIFRLPAPGAHRTPRRRRSAPVEEVSAE